MGRRKEVAGENGLRWKKAWEARRRVGSTKTESISQVPRRGTEVRIFKLDTGGPEPNRTSFQT